MVDRSAVIRPVYTSFFIFAMMRVSAWDKSAVRTMEPRPPMQKSVAAFVHRAVSGFEEDESSSRRPSIFGSEALAYVDATKATDANESLQLEGGG